VIKEEIVIQLTLKYAILHAKYHTARHRAPRQEQQIDVKINKMREKIESALLNVE
jgi:hypothetical protein